MKAVIQCPTGSGEQNNSSREAAQSGTSAEHADVQAVAAELHGSSLRGVSADGTML